VHELIRKYEGFRPEAYLCPAGIGTVGYGTTRIDGHPVAKGARVTEEEAGCLLDSFVASEILPNIAGLKLKGRQAEAVVSLIYNIGWPAFERSKLKRAILERDYAGICREWDFGFRNNLKGLFKRRVEELWWFISEI
jgi:GH24 family phage-related lysozyme (muramidase)